MLYLFYHTKKSLPSCSLQASKNVKFFKVHARSVFGLPHFIDKKQEDREKRWIYQQRPWLSDFRAKDFSTELYFLFWDTSITSIFWAFQ